MTEITNINQRLENLKQAFLVLSDAIGKSFKPIVEKFNRQMYSIAEMEYKRVHDRLPGSTRTSRLRQKRRKAVLDWFGGYINCDESSKPSEVTSTAPHSPPVNPDQPR